MMYACRVTLLMEFLSLIKTQTASRSPSYENNEPLSFDNDLSMGRRNQRSLWPIEIV